MNVTIRNFKTGNCVMFANARVSIVERMPDRFQVVYDGHWSTAYALSKWSHTTHAPLTPPAPPGMPGPRLAERLREGTPTSTSQSRLMHEAADRLDELDPPPVKLSERLEDSMEACNCMEHGADEICGRCCLLRDAAIALEAHDE